MKFKLIIEKAGAKEFSGRIEDKGKFMPNTIASDIGQVKRNIRMVIKDYQQHEGKQDKFWKKIDPAKIEYEILYDIQAFFEDHPYLNISKLAELAGLDPNLVQQYANGRRHASKEHAKKIERTLTRLANKLKTVSLV